MYTVIIFGITLTINPIAFTLPIGEGWDVYWYGIIIAIGFLAAVIYAMFVAKRYEIDTDRMLDVALITTPIAILCARLYYVIFDGEKLESVADFFGFGDNSGFRGLAIYGGVIGAFACGMLMCKLRKLNVLDMFDLAATCFLLAQGIGRWGNFFNQEAYGTFTGSSWWGMMSNQTVYEMGTGLVHPCFLYEFVWCIAGFFILNYLGKHRKFKGELVLGYGIWYGFGRGFIELLRTDSLMLGNIRVSSLLSFTLFAVCLVLFILAYKRSAKAAVATEYVSMFKENEEAEQTVIETAKEGIIDDEQDN